MSISRNINRLSLASTIGRRWISTSLCRAAVFTQDIEEDGSYEWIAERKAETQIRRLGRQSWDRCYFFSPRPRFRSSCFSVHPEDGAFPEPPESRWKAFADIVSGQRAAFALGGKINSEDIALENMALYYQEGRETKRVLFPPSEKQLRDLCRHAVPSPFGRGGETVMDPTYRQAKEFKPPNFALSHDLISNSNIIPTLSAFLPHEGHIKVTLNKLNIYTKGGFFKPHRDTPLGPGHIGTLTICLPTEFTGGQLVVSKDGEAVTFDWSRSEDSGVMGAIRRIFGKRDTTVGPSREIDWAFLYSDVRHEILPVTCGTRLTVAYAVWHFTEAQAIDKSDLDNTPLQEHLTALLADFKYFLPDGGRLAFGAQHAYSVPRNDPSLSLLRTNLKGRDAVLGATLDRIGLKWELKPVFDTLPMRSANERDPFDDVSDYFLPSDMQWSWKAEAKSDVRPDLSEHLLLDPDVMDTHSCTRYHTLIGSDFWAIYGKLGGFDSDVYEDVRGWGGAVYERDLIWVTLPEHYEHKVGYWTQGNGPVDPAVVYMSVAFVVDVPGWTTRSDLLELEQYRRKQDAKRGRYIWGDEE